MMKSQLRKVLPNKIIFTISSMRIRIKSFLSRHMVKYRITSALYYFIFDFQYHREQQATLAGKITYEANEGGGEKSNALLRRNTHRLEKGLIMVPRKAIFAESYILETVQCFSHSLQQGSIHLQELKWAQDVLEKYFEAVEHSSIIQQANNIFEQLPLVNDQESTQSVPYLHSERTLSNIDSESLHQLFKQRRSTRWFEDRKVDIQIIKQAVEMASQAPSACNRQPFQFYTITDAKKASQIAAIPMGTKGFAENIQALLVIVGDLSFYPKERDRHVIYIDGGLVAMQLMLAFESLGLSTCPINWPDIELYEKKMDKALSLKKHQRPIMLMAVGYGKKDGGIPFSQKKNADQLVKELD